MLPADGIKMCLLTSREQQRAHPPRPTHIPGKKVHLQHRIFPGSELKITIEQTSLPPHTLAFFYIAAGQKPQRLPSMAIGPASPRWEAEVAGHDIKLTVLTSSLSGTQCFPVGRVSVS